MAPELAGGVPGKTLNTWLQPPFRGRTCSMRLCYVLEGGAGCPTGYVRVCEGLANPCHPGAPSSSFLQV